LANQEQIDALATMFDVIYPLETNLLGYEYGGGLQPGDIGYGGMDGDPPIQILICDIDGDYNMSRKGVTLGYFYSVDEYAKVSNPNSQYFYSNEAEIFYLDAEMLDARPETIYSTLVHEFNHMINFNVKVKQQNDKWSNWESWYTEMLSLLAEDVMGPLVEIPYDLSLDNGNVIRERIPTWLASYADYGVMHWDNGNPLPYYASNYAFGAYLVRNFGGPGLLSRIAKSDLGGEVSLDEALTALNGSHATARYALSRFGEALVYSGSSQPSGVYSFDKEVPGLVNGESYTFPAFDIWDISYTTTTGGPVYIGPKTYTYESGIVIPGKGLKLFQHADWKKKTGNLRACSISLQNPKLGI
jgi:hypothetical protein